MKGALLIGLLLAACSVGEREPEDDVETSMPEKESAAVARKGGDAGEDLVVTRSMRLDPSRKYRTIVIATSDVELDCAGATVDPNYSERYGIIIGTMNAESFHAIKNVTLRNCTVVRTRRAGIQIGHMGCDAAKLELPVEERYRRHPQDILIDNVRVAESANTGLFVDDYVQRVTITNSRFERNAALGMYLTHHSRRNIVRGNYFEKNGLGEKVVPHLKPGGRREALAIDASQENVIEDNVFIDNYGGGIRLYRNCWERSEDPCSVERDVGANGNVIRNNQITGGQVGVWIASRQNNDVDKPGSRCGMKLDPAKGKFNDDAKNNLVTGNKIRRVERGVVAADDGNRVEENDFGQIREACVEVGSAKRSERFGAPVTGVEVSGNICRLSDKLGDDAAVRLIVGSKAKVEDNQIKR